MIDYGSSMYPTKLNKIINLFESLPEEMNGARRFVSYADNALKKQEPREGENFELVDVRKRRGMHRYGRRLSARGY